VPADDDFGQGIGLWQMTDAPSIPDAIKALADGVIPRSVLRYASASDRGAAIDAPVEGMVTYREDANVLEVYTGSAWVTPPSTVTSTTSGLTSLTGFAINSFYGLKEGRTVALDISLERTGGAITNTNGNIADTACCVVPSGWRPTHQTINGPWDSGTESGSFVIGVDGICTLRTSSDNINTGANLRLHITFITA
jgi:hypothetical protein